MSSRNKDSYYQDDDSKSNCSNNNINNKKYNSKIMVLDDDFDIAVILMTAFDVNNNLLTENTKSTANKNNIIQIIQKPISPKKLAKTVFSLH